MKNSEGYNDPTANQALALEVMREKLRRQYNIREGQKIRIKKELLDTAGNKAKKENQSNCIRNT